MARTKISEFSSTAADNTDIDGIDIAEGCAPSGINNAIRTLMADLKDMQTGASGDTFTFASLNATTANIDGGTIDGATIGGSSAAAGTFTSLSDSGNLTFTGTGNRITGDFSNATVVNRVIFQTSTANLGTTIVAIPNGTAGGAFWDSCGASDPTNASVGKFGLAANSEVTVRADRYGTGTYLPITFYTGGSERMRIDSSGNLLVGTTNSSITAGDGFKLTDGGQAPAIVSAYSTNANSSYLMYSTGAAAYRFYVRWDGVIQATSTTITGISDQRLKENVQDLDEGLAKIMALKPRRFDWKSGKGRNVKGDRGWIAQEFEQVFPDMIDESLDPVPEGEEPYKTVRADLLPVLVKAIQEQQQMINELRSEIAAFKGA